MTSAWLLCAIAVAAVAAEPAAAVAAATGAGAAYTRADAERWVRQAERMRLDRSPQWRALLHVVPTMAGERSLIDDPRFFADPLGDIDPAAELRATLRAFTAPVRASASHACERFPARLEFLAAALDLDRARLPRPGSADFERAWAHHRPQAASLVFASAFINSPSSAFGHTFLTIRGRWQADRLRQALNYAAWTEGESGGALYALKGLFGGFGGYFSMQPYYEKLREYGDLERRDLWEYDLDLRPAELRMLLLHVHELTGIRSDYWFFDENCSHALLLALDAARPSLALHARAGMWVIPIDTVRWIHDAGMVTGVRYRPSQTSTVRHLAAGLDAPLLDQVEAVVRAGASAAALARGRSASAAAPALDLAANWLQLDLTRQRLALADYQQRTADVLRERARLGVRSESAPPPMPVPPHTGHAAARVRLRAGEDLVGPWAEVALRPAFHDLLDDGAGFLPGGQIDFMQVAVQARPGEGARLHQAEVLRLRSFAAADRFITPVSWELGTGWRRVPGDGRWDAHAYLDGGGGLTIATVLGDVSMLAVADARARTHGRGWSLAAGPAAWLRAQPTVDSTLLLHARWMPALAGDDADRAEATVQWRWHPAREAGIGVEAGWERSWDQDGGLLAVVAAWTF